MMLLGKGHWSLHSDMDVRWNREGNGQVGGLAMPADCRKALEELKKKLGEPPADLEWNYYKF